MEDNRHANSDELAKLKSEFQKAVNAVKIVFGKKAFRKVKVSKEGKSQWDSAINRAVFEIQMIGLKDIPEKDLFKLSKSIVNEFERLCIENRDFADVITRSTADRTRFYKRFIIFRNILKSLSLFPPILKILPSKIEHI